MTASVNVTCRIRIDRVSRLDVRHCRFVEAASISNSPSPPAGGPDLPSRSAIMPASICSANTTSKVGRPKRQQRLWQSFTGHDIAPLHHRVKTLDCRHDTNPATRGCGPLPCNGNVLSLSRPHSKLGHRGRLGPAGSGRLHHPARICAHPGRRTAPAGSWRLREPQEPDATGAFRKPAASACVSRPGLFRSTAVYSGEFCRALANGRTRLWKLECRDQGLPQLDCRRRRSRPHPRRADRGR
jgi:hypothetical protein